MKTNKRKLKEFTIVLCGLTTLCLCHALSVAVQSDCAANSLNHVFDLAEAAGQMAGQDPTNVSTEN